MLSPSADDVADDAGHGRLRAAEAEARGELFRGLRGALFVARVDGGQALAGRDGVAVFLLSTKPTARSMTLSLVARPPPRCMLTEPGCARPRCRRRSRRRGRHLQRHGAAGSSEVSYTTRLSPPWASTSSRAWRGPSRRRCPRSSFSPGLRVVGGGAGLREDARSPASGRAPAGRRRSPRAGGRWPPSLPARCPRRGPAAGPCP